MATLDNADEAVEGLMGLAAATTELTIRKRLADGDDVHHLVEISTSGRRPLPTANWSHVENGKITAIRVAFDPRLLCWADLQRRTDRLRCEGVQRLSLEASAARAPT